MHDLREEIRQFCAQKGIRLKKGLGQNFLIDKEILMSIITAADIQPDDHIVEIGAGIGILTRELIQKAKKVTAIELDANLIPLLKEFLRSLEASEALPAGRQVGSSLEVINENALQTTYPNTPYKIVANIPYHITSPLLRKVFVESPTPPHSLTLLIQREVAEKICDTKDAGILTILIGLFGKPNIVRGVPPSSFLPAPKVDSAVLHVECFAKPIADRKTIEEIFRLVKIGFSQKRKMLRNTIGGFAGGLELLEAAGIDEKRRPQHLSLEEWIALAKHA